MKDEDIERLASLWLSEHKDEYDLIKKAFVFAYRRAESDVVYKSCEQFRTEVEQANRIINIATNEYDSNLIDVDRSVDIFRKSIMK